jgi:hypothetical protein
VREVRRALVVLVRARQRRRAPRAQDDPPPVRELGLFLLVLLRLGVELLDAEERAGGVFKLGDAFTQRRLADVDDGDDVALAPLELVQQRRDPQRGAAHARRPPPGLHPVALHARDEPQGGVRHRVHLSPEVELVGEAVDEQRGVDRFAHERVLLEAEEAAQLQEHRAQDVHVRLHDVAEVDEHVRPGLLPAHDVQARAGHLLRPAASGEIPLHRQLVQPVRGARDVLARADAQAVRHLRDLVLALVDRLLVRVHLEAEDAPAPRAAAHTRGDAALGDEVAVHLGGAAGGLREGRVRGEDVVVQNLTASRAAPAMSEGRGG